MKVTAVCMALCAIIVTIASCFKLLKAYCTLLFKMLGSVGFLNVFDSLLCSQSLHLFDQIYRNIVKYYYSSKCLFSILIYFKM